MSSAALAGKGKETEQNLQQVIKFIEKCKDRAFIIQQRERLGKVGDKNYLHVISVNRDNYEAGSENYNKLDNEYKAYVKIASALLDKATKLEKTETKPKVKKAFFEGAKEARDAKKSRNEKRKEYRQQVREERKQEKKDKKSGWKSM